MCCAGKFGAGEDLLFIAYAVAILVGAKVGHVVVGVLGATHGFMLSSLNVYKFFPFPGIKGIYKCIMKRNNENHGEQCRPPHAHNGHGAIGQVMAGLKLRERRTYDCHIFLWFEDHLRYP